MRTTESRKSKKFFLYLPLKFTSYNEKYNILNIQLERLKHEEWKIMLENDNGQGQSLDDYWEMFFEDEPTETPDYISAAFKYINLCSEEYYWFRKKFIDEDVWDCWMSKMKNWYESSYFIRKVVDTSKPEEYYNCDFLNLINSNK